MVYKKIIIDIIKLYIKKVEFKIGILNCNFMYFFVGTYFDCCISSGEVVNCTCSLFGLFHLLAVSKHHINNTTLSHKMLHLKKNLRNYPQKSAVLNTTVQKVLCKFFLFGWKL